MKRSRGRPEIAVALIDGPVALDHPDLAGQRIREIGGRVSAVCLTRDSVACSHGTFVAGMLAAKRGSAAPAICPECTFLLRPIFSETKSRHDGMPTATPDELAAAIVDSVEAGARVLNLSVNLTSLSAGGETRLSEALNFAASRGVIPVVAAANQGAAVGSTLTRHAWALPVMACDHIGRPLQGSNLSPSVGRRGISAPGKEIASLGTNGKPQTISGTSPATAFVTGTIALLWSELPTIRAADVRFAITNHSHMRRASLVPPMLNAFQAYQTLVREATGRTILN